MKVELSEDAEADMTGILVYTLQEFGPGKVEKYFALLREGLEIISNFLLAGHTRRDLPYSLLAYPIGEHILIYEVVNKSSIIVYRILHSRMDFSGKM